MLDSRAARSLDRLLPRLKLRFDDLAPDAWEPFRVRLETHFPPLFERLLLLYGGQYDFFWHLESLLDMAARMWIARPADLKALDARRESDPLWFQSQAMLGGVCYVDLFAGTLVGIRDKIDYFRELGLTYLHLMPLFAAPEGENDGGYAVSSYHDIAAHLGTMDELADLAADLRANGISLVVDFILNHTSDEHTWAARALEGDPDYQAFYYMFPDRLLPDQYERTLREIFPDQRPGSFTFRPEIGRWVWTTFHSFQWDLNYTNPAVFHQMAQEMLFLANQGVEILRFDAIAFIWKRLGTSCENLPEALLLVEAWNRIARIAAPALLFKSEAIVHPDEVIKYIRADRCQLSYNPLLMALLWEALATRDARLLQYSMATRFKIPPDTAWLNYVRSHDDIGWTFDDGDAARLNLNGFDHRRFLNQFYIGRFDGSFARGVPFQENPRTGDARISGTAASLAGLEKALREEGPDEVELALRRILLLYGVCLAIGGIPLIYLGDEVATLNDYSYRAVPAKGDDSRWVHRPATDWDKVARRQDPTTIEGRLYQRLHHLIDVRKGCEALGGLEMEVFDTHNPHIFGFIRQGHTGRVLVLGNFTERPQTVTVNQVRIHGLGYRFHDLVTGATLDLTTDLTLEPYQLLWLTAE